MNSEKNMAHLSETQLNELKTHGLDIIDYMRKEIFEARAKQARDAKVVDEVKSYMTKMMAAIEQGK